MAVEHQAQIIAYSADPHDLRLTLMVQCSCGRQWGWSKDSRENEEFLQKSIQHYYQWMKEIEE
jgi:hypothetical protein